MAEKTMVGGVGPGDLLWAVHIADGVLTTPWLGAGFALAAVLALVAAFRVRDEEIPQIALLTAAFFVASLLHVRVGPTSVHLLLNGLVGVVLGRRAGLAIPVGLALQAALLGHGGFSTLGVNACVMTLPALLASVLFTVLHRVRWLSHPWFQTTLVAFSFLTWGLSLVFSIVLLATNHITQVEALNPGPALQATFHPLTLAGIGLFALVVARYERRLGHAPEFPLGLFLGVLSVLVTLVLNALVLLYGGAEDWHSIVLLVFVAHLPIAVVEGIILGMTVGFLVRVKPEMLGIRPLEEREETPSRESSSIQAERPAPITLRPPTLLLVLVGILVTAAPAQAHRLDAAFQVLPGGKVEIESWFDLTNQSPRGATVQVFRSGGQLLVDGKLNEKGLFLFRVNKAERLKVVVSAGAGHRKELVIPQETLEKATLLRGGDQVPADAVTDDAEEPSSFADRRSQVSIKDVLIGVGFLLALASFVLSWRNARRLQELQKLGSP
jgi:cobalt/nickel transport system permease protein